MSRSASPRPPPSPGAAARSPSRPSKWLKGWSAAPFPCGCPIQEGRPAVRGPARASPPSSGARPSTRPSRSRRRSTRRSRTRGARRAGRRAAPPRPPPRTPWVADPCAAAAPRAPRHDAAGEERRHDPEGDDRSEGPREFIHTLDNPASSVPPQAPHGETPARLQEASGRRRAATKRQTGAVRPSGRLSPCGCVPRAPRGRPRG